MAGTKLSKPRPVFFFDIDNCLYPRSAGIQDHMQRLIGVFIPYKPSKSYTADLRANPDDYFVRHLSLPPEDARMLHSKYYKEYGLAISGLVKYHKIDPLAYNREVDDALPLDDIIKPDPKLRKLLSDIDTSKVKPWLFTNAHVTHARRVVKLLGVEDMFEGVTYCDYSKQPLLAKPHVEMFEKAEKEAGAQRAEDCYFVDDSLLNCRHASERGWTVVLKLEEGDKEAERKEARHQITDLQRLREIFPQFFKSGQSSNLDAQQGTTSQL